MKISIITVCKNSALFIGDAIQSVLSQMHQDYEYIIVDGNSTDSTLEIIKNQEALFKGRLKWISEPDRGLYDAINKGIKLATGEIVGLLNSDDFFSADDILGRIASEFDDTSIQAIYGDVKYVKPINTRQVVRYYSSDIFTPGLMRMGFMPAHPSFYIRRQCFMQYGYYSLDYQISSDFEFLLRYLYLHRIKTKYIQMDFVTMRLGGISNATLLSYVSIMREHQRALKQHRVYSNILLLSLRYIFKLKEFILLK